MAINFAAQDFYDSLIEIVGYKCGVALSKQKLKELLRSLGYDEYGACKDGQWIRIHSSSYEEIIYDLLKAFGRIEPGFSRFPTISMFHKYKGDKALYVVFNSVMEMWLDWTSVEIENVKASGKKLMDPTRLLLTVFEKHGKVGVNMAYEVLVGMNAAMLASPWANLRQVEWTSKIDLQDLFESEGLNAEYGTFIDQRYIDFLNANFSEIDRMHWRKFEHLTAEFLDRNGYRVELGPGRGDDGVDVRAWSKDDSISKPLIIVQCKRQKASVDKPIIKSLYADVVHEEAKSGLLVTTSRLSVGAEQTRMARAYPIDVADRSSLRKWLESLRTPGVGGFQS
ncbi:restriction endonuclease [Rhodopseudomonas palustris]|uniref:restriction endonuclease n=1 Tax=Rhodopseudomonas palustris TaxID=1076 RepID=UPI0020CD5F8F|nr:restriction endonuclease [Rhodopseudomonas palustris]MCP9625479.1 restriction endonuclease [Rhodopseudomonas palustris]